MCEVDKDFYNPKSEYNKQYLETRISFVIVPGGYKNETIYSNHPRAIRIIKPGSNTFY